MIKLFKEQEAQQYIDAIASLRINIFREFPYLYDGDHVYEKKYLNKFVNTPDSIICIAFENGNIVGALTGLPLKFEEVSIKEPWLTSEYNIDEIYYFSEVLLLPENRGRGLGVELLNVAEEWVQRLNKYQVFTLATVVREKNHVQKPVEYKSLDIFWQKRGYSKTDSITCLIHWKEIGELEETTKELIFWSKQLHFLSDK